MIKKPNLDYASISQTKLNSDISHWWFKSLDEMIECIEDIDNQNSEASMYPVYLFTHEDDDAATEEPAEVIVTSNICVINEFLKNKEWWEPQEVQQFFLQEYSTWEDAYKTALEMKERFHNCYN